MSATIALPGFADPVGEAQATFRAVLDAMARPGRLHHGGRAADRAGAARSGDRRGAADAGRQRDAAVARSPPQRAARDWLAFHCGAAIVDAPDKAAFAVALSLPDLAALPAGSHEAPESRPR